MNIFTQLCKAGSGQIAKRRLTLLLASDCAGCSPELIQMIQTDLFRVVSKYMEVEKDHIQIQVDGQSARAVFHVSLPVRSISNKGLY